MEIQILDVDYVLVNERPVIRIFGKDADGRSVCGFHEGFLPYFYVKGNATVENALRLEQVKRKMVGEGEKDFTKVTLANPAKTPDVRELLIQQGREVFEADILFRYRFMADTGLKGMGWVKVAEENGVATQTVQVEKTFKAVEMKPLEKEENVPLRIMALDVECVSLRGGVPDAGKDPLIMISLAFSPAFKGRSSFVLSTKACEGAEVCESEQAMLEEFINIIGEYDPDVLTGFNCNNFDFPYILTRMERNGVRPVFGRCRTKQVFAKKMGARYRIGITGRVIVDSFQIVKKDFSLQRYNLDFVSRKLLGKEKENVKHSEIEKLWNGSRDDVKRLADYARKDAELALALIVDLTLMDKYIALSKIAGTLLQDTLEGGETVRIENFLLREFNREGYVFSSRPSPREIAERDKRKEQFLVGGYVLEPKKRLHSSVVVLDFKCFVGNTNILTNKGLLPIKDIVDKKLNVSVYSYETGKFVESAVVNRFKYKVPAKTSFVKITTSGGSEVVCTPNHLFFAYDTKSNKMLEIAAKDMQRGTLLIEPRALQVEGQESNISPHKAKFLGYLFSEGYSTRRFVPHGNHYDKASQSILTFGNTEADVVQDCVHSVENEYRYTPAIYPQRGSLNVRVTSKKIYDDIEGFLTKIRRERSESSPSSIQRVPERLYAMPRDTKAAFLNAYFSGDGTVNKTRNEVVLTSCNRKMLEDIKLLLLHFTITSRINNVMSWYRKDGNKIYKKAYHLSICGKDNLKKFAQDIGFTGEKQRRLVRAINSKKAQHTWNVAGDFKLVRVRDVGMLEAGEETYVYDLQVANNSHSFIADFLLVHNSMYPSIIRSFNICPTTLVKEGGVKTPSGARFLTKEERQGITPRILEELMDKRQKVKKKLKKVSDPSKKRVLYAEQWALKILANAFYGHFGYSKARVFNLDVANSITGYGREIIGRTAAEIREKFGYEVVYGDTDSVFVVIPEEDIEKIAEKGREIAAYITKDLPGVMELEFEKIFKRFLPLTKKRYAAWCYTLGPEGWEEGIEMKGIETVRRDWCDLVSETLREVIDVILKKNDIKEAVHFFKGIVDDLVKGTIPIQKLVITKTMTKLAVNYMGMQPHIELVKKLQVRSPQEAPGIGDRIPFVIVKGTDLLSKRAEDPVYIIENGLQVDSHYYIENQLLPPLERIFTSLNISKSELLGNGKQIGILEALRNRKPEKQEEIVLQMQDLTGFICEKCSSFYPSVPMLGVCKCGGKILFASKKGHAEKMVVN